GNWSCPHGAPGTWLKNAKAKYDQAVMANQVWQSGVQRAVRHTIADQQQQALLADLERHFNPPPPPAPEPEVVYVEAVEGSDQLGTSDFNPKLRMQKPRSWF